MYDVGVRESSEEICVASAEICVHFFQGDEASTALIQILLYGVEHFHTAVESRLLDTNTTFTILLNPTGKQH
jgi:hypothetical protein